ncbi:DPY30 domain-containing protein 1-like isoform X2 [Sphaerodactylus townsendi]|uniref:DPY30 domain-containing protein 1-like isoform X2 n=1 Tax=Sphaerodactylus townsendi TaxID=933632 RepID=UPI0020263C70|nr:DPY30 domain-containing protein 1-like isoform X2 [Sphaerodactylus townsendi]
MDVQYLKECLGQCLVEGLAKVVERQPVDPINFLACWIYRYKTRLNEDEKRKTERVQLEQEREEVLAEIERIEKMKAEEIQIARKHEQQQKKVTEEKDGNLPEEKETTELKQKARADVQDPGELNTAEDELQETFREISRAIGLREALTEPIPEDDLDQISDDEAATQSEHSEESENEPGDVPDEEYKSSQDLNAE